MQTLKIFSWNVNGIRAVLRKDVFMPFIEEHQPDILCLQETKAKPGQAEIDLPEYEEIWNSAERAGYAGTAIFSKLKPLRTMADLPEDLAVKYQLGDGYGDANNEGRVLMAEYEGFYLLTVYTPNAKEDLSRVPLRYEHWDPAFLEYAKRLEQDKPVVFCGDLNVAHAEEDLARPKENRGKKGFTDEERAGFDAFVQAGFIDTLRLFKSGNGHYTWWSHWGGARARNVGWRIDYFLVSGALKDNVVSADIHPAVVGSDHCPVSLELKI